jgi:hypothetical protein
VRQSLEKKVLGFLWRQKRKRRRRLLKNVPLKKLRVGKQPPGLECDPDVEWVKMWREISALFTLARPLHIVGKRDRKH